LYQPDWKEDAPLSSELSADWVAAAEHAIRQLRDVQAAHITTDGDLIKEIHVVAASTRQPKQIVRDVETTLKAVLRRAVDHRIISVALTTPDASAAPAPAPPDKGGEGDKRGASEQQGASEKQSGGSERPQPVSDPRPGPSERELAEEKHRRQLGEPRAMDSGPGRVRFGTANLFVSGLRTQAQVELVWQGVTRVGNATGASARDNAYRLLSSATLNALLPYLGEEVTLAPHEVEIVRLGRQEIVVVTVKLLAQRAERTLVGSCTVEQDVAQSVVYATLAAVNRVLGGLRSREPEEYELRPTST
jgi:hypothetical protein